jgi:hypothetical protein
MLLSDGLNEERLEHARTSTVRERYIYKEREREREREREGERRVPWHLLVVENLNEEHFCNSLSLFTGQRETER